MGEVKLHTVYKTKTGQIVPSVTQIIGQNLGWNKPALLAWTRREVMEGRDPTKVTERAGDRGTLVHKLIEAFLRNEEVDATAYPGGAWEEAVEIKDVFATWWTSEGYVVEASEKALVNEKLLYGGTIDILARHGSNLDLLDIKTSKGVYEEHWIQVAAYGALLPKKQNVNRYRIINIPNAGQLAVLNKTDVSDHFDIFRHLLAIDKLKKSLKEAE